MSSESGHSLLRKVFPPFVVVPAALLLAWIAFAIWVRPALDGATLLQLASVGDAAGPLATALTLAAVMLAFSQARDAREQAKFDREQAKFDREQSALDREQSRADRESAYLERLAHAYARWIPIARSTMSTINEMTNAINHACWHGDNDAKLKARLKLREVSPLFTEINIAATEVLLVERDPATRTQVEQFIALPTMAEWPQFEFGARNGATPLVGLVHKRRVALEELVAAISTRLSRGQITAVPIPASPDEPPKGPGEPDASTALTTPTTTTT